MALMFSAVSIRWLFFC